jgi:hypothetical protein
MAVAALVVGQAIASAAPAAKARDAQAAGPKPTGKPAEQKAPADVDALLAGLSKAPGLYARFREEKHITLLQQPLVSEGSIYFAPPSRFARHTEKPITSTMVIDGNQLQFGNADGQESMNLGTNPVARLFADAFVMLLSGNRPGSRRSSRCSSRPRSAASGSCCSPRAWRRWTS